MSFVYKIETCKIFGESLDANEYPKIIRSLMFDRSLVIFYDQCLSGFKYRYISCIFNLLLQREIFLVNP